MQFLKKIWEGWKAFGRFLGDLLARVVLTVFYFTVFMPFGLGVTLLSDPLAVKSTPAHLWRPRKTEGQSLAEVMRQF